MPIQLDVDARAILEGLRRIVRALRDSSNRAEKSVGLSGAQLFILHQLSPMRPLSVNQVANRTLTHQSTVSVVVRRLVQRGLVVKTTSAGDRRSVALTLTARGNAVLRRSPDPAQAPLIEGVRRLSATDRKALARLLTRVAGSMEGTGRPEAMFFEGASRRGVRS